MDYDNQLEHFSLRWNNYNDNMKTGFHDLLRREDFVDVTIAAEGKLIQAHKMVLSICSPYFKNIFKANPCQHPVVFLKDVTHKELAGILQFMYLGEVSVQQEELGRFLKTAEALQIKGLTSEDSENKVITQDEDENFQEQKEQSKCNGTHKTKSKVLSNDLPERLEAKKMKMNSTTNDVNRVNSQLPGMELSKEGASNHDDQESQTLVKNEPPELDYYDIECDKISLQEDNSGFSDYNVLDTSSEVGDDVNNSPGTGNNSGVGQDLNNIQGNLEVYKPVEGNQEIRFVVSQRRRLCLVFNDYLYIKDHVGVAMPGQPRTIYWRCKDITCKARCIQTDFKFRLKRNTFHQHQPNADRTYLPIPLKQAYEMMQLFN
ncbi:UNVERIFIED_CONTAM: hypothetical protein PYX00_001474 [Menopon gallinae]|uniref:BTB domain-containing protein n=1 Tax=Menopon gallinae TaxID=328185 RepID=A0AAW2IE34_9NEOP